MSRRHWTWLVWGGICLFGFNSNTLAQKPTAAEVIPKGKPIMLDGRIDPREWQDAKEIELSKKVKLFMKRDADCLYVAVKPDRPDAFGVDLYVDNEKSKNLLNLHASAKLGEREGTPGQWPEWKWWNNQGWTGNVARIVDFDKRDFMDDEAREMQIKLSRLGSGSLWLSLDVHTGSGTASLPETGTERHTRRWIRVRI